MHAILSSLIYIAYHVGLHGWMLLDCLDSNKASTIPDLIYLASAAALGQACQPRTAIAAVLILLPLDLSGWRDIVVAYVCPSICLLVCKIYLHNNSSQIWARITKFAPNMHHGMILVGIENMGHWPWPSRSLWPFCLRILGNSACPHDNSSQIWARITKFAPNMHPGILSAGIENGGHWPWPSRSSWPFWLRILANLACPHDITVTS